MTLQPKPVRSTTFYIFDGDAENVPAATKIGKEPEEGERGYPPVYSIYEEAEAAQGKDRPRTVYVDKDNNPFVYENILNSETGEYESQLVPFDKSVEIVPAYCVVTKSDNWSFPGGTGAYEIIKLEHEILLGDGTNDGKVNMSDIIMAIAQVSATRSILSVNVDALDVNRDGKVDTRDIIILVRYANNYTQNVPVGQPISSSPHKSARVHFSGKVYFFRASRQIIKERQKSIFK